MRVPKKMMMMLGGFVPWYLAGGVAKANCVAVYQPKGAADLAASYINIINPGTYNAAPGTAPTWDAVNGWKFAEASLQYLTTGIVSAAGWSIICKFTNVGATSDRRLLGAADAAYAGITALVPWGTAGTVVEYDIAGHQQPKAPAIASGTLGIAGLKSYRNGIDEGITAVPVAYPIQPHYIGAMMVNGGPQFYITAYIQAVAYYNTTLTPAQMLAISTAMAAL